MRGTHEQPIGLELRLDVLTQAEETALLQQLRHLAMGPMVLQGTPSKRLVHHFGVAYDAQSQGISDTDPAPPLIRDAIDAAIRAFDRSPRDFAEVLATYYPPGAGIGEHRDAPAFGAVVGLSLLNSCTMKFALDSGADRRVWEQVLPPRSAYLLDGPARTMWRHRIDAVKWERWSLTGRTLRKDSGPSAQRPERDSGGSRDIQ